MNTMPTPPTTDREAIGEAPNPLGLNGIEYVEYTTAQPQALGQVIERLGFRPVARHRSREVLLYRQGGLHVVINAQPGLLKDVRPGAATADGTPRITALALRVQDARAAHERALALGAWEVPVHAQVMELNIPGIHGPGGAHIYFVDRWDEFSIYSVDFRPVPGTAPDLDAPPPAVPGLHFFGLVQYIGQGRTEDWVAFYTQLLGFVRLPADTHFGVLPKGTLLKSPCAAEAAFHLQLIEPPADAPLHVEPERFHRIGLGTADVPGTVATLRRRGLEFVDTGEVRPSERGAITRTVLHSVVFELVHDLRP